MNDALSSILDGGVVVDDTDAWFTCYLRNSKDEILILDFHYRSVRNGDCQD